MAHEVELKLAIATADIPRLKRHPAITAAASDRPVTRKLLSIYYDTPQLALLDLGLSLRVRRMSGQWFQAVKDAGHARAGLHQRMEWEDIIAFDHPDFSKITDPDLTRVFDDPALRAALAPVFRTEVSRTEWQLAWDNGDRVELALDLGQLVAGDHREPISEIELELKGGNTGRLFTLALALQQDIPLTLENVSKAQRGYARYRPQAPVVVRAHRTRLDGNADGRSAFRQIAWECLGQLQGNQDMVLHGEDIEGVHQMRVALRRLRSAISIFRETAGDGYDDAMSDDLRWITATLGSARDLDVFLGHTLPPVLAQLPDHPGLSRLRELATAARGQAYRTARDALVSQRYQRLLLALGAWLEMPATDGTPRNVRDIAHDTLAKRYRQLRRHGRRLLHMHPEERHDTRIAAKKLRYAAEFFASLYPAAGKSPLLPHLAGLLDILGALNDIAVTEQLVRQVTGKRNARALDEALHLLTGWNACNAAHRLDHLELAWRRFRRAQPFWDA